MDGRLRDGEVVVGEGGRNQFYDTRGYGRPLGQDEAPAPGALALAQVEAAHLLFRGDLDAVAVEDRCLGFREFFAAFVDPARFFVYKDLRDRGFYLSVRDDLVVYPRGKGPWDDEVRFRVRPAGERDPVPAATLGGVVLGVADEESELTYLATEGADPSGEAGVEAPDAEAELVDDRALVWEPPAALHGTGFYGRPLDDEGDAGDGADGDSAPLQLSLVEAAHLVAVGALTVEGGVPAVLERGRAVEGERFDRRLRAYRGLRDRGLVPKTGFKFGADFRVYTAGEERGHAESLVRVLPPGYEFTPRELSLYVRLAHGVRKRMLFAVDDGDGVEWLAVRRLTP
ncbi:MAG: tRNA-intron lyase [Halobacteriaceae archaeon]